jgi:hypothetical protein
MPKALCCQLAAMVVCRAVSVGNCLAVVGLNAGLLAPKGAIAETSCNKCEFIRASPPAPIFLGAALPPNQLAIANNECLTPMRITLKQLAAQYVNDGIVPVEADSCVVEASM